MKQTCKQCGREFELTDKEVEFYESKGLNLPSRCKECRQAKKAPQGQKKAQPGQEQHNSSEAALLKAQGNKGQATQADREEDQSFAPGWTRGKLIATCVIMAIVLIVCFGGTYLVHQFL